MHYCLGIESTAHTFGVGIIDFDGKIVANAKDSFTTEQGGLIPAEVAKHHDAVKDRVFAEALAQAKLQLNDIALIAYSRGPGLTSAILAVGQKFAIELA